MLPQGALSCCECLDIFEDGSRCWNERLGSLKRLNHHLYRKFIEVFRTFSWTTRRILNQNFELYIINCGFSRQILPTKKRQTPQLRLVKSFSFYQFTLRHVTEKRPGIRKPSTVGYLGCQWYEGKWIHSSAIGPQSTQSTNPKKNKKHENTAPSNYKRLGGGFRYFFIFTHTWGRFRWVESIN